MTKTDVLIVGAGPTGLTLANELALFGVDFRVVEKAPYVSQFTKALGVQARTLELLEAQGVTDEFVRRGVPVTSFNILSELEQIAHFDLGRIDSPYPYLLMLPQNEVEEILLARLRDRGGAVSYETSLTSFTDHGDSVSASVVRADGSTEEISARYLVGTDGARSTVRHLLGLEFEGESFEQSFAVADVRVDWSLSRDEVFAFLNRGRFMAFFPMAKGMHRVAIAYPAGTEPAGDVTLDELQAGLERTGPAGARILSADWTSRFRINQRKASRQAVGRVLLAGDAAHIHSLVGAQGMNTGIQDAINLGWKLAAALRGGAPQALLDSYETERGAVARRLVEGTRRFTRMTLLGGTLTTAFRRNIAPLVLSRPHVRHRIETAVAQLDVAYPSSPLRGGSSAGERVVDGELMSKPGESFRLHSLLRDRQHVLLFLEGPTVADAAFAEVAGLVEPYGIAVHRIRTGARESGVIDEGTWCDPGGFVHERLGAVDGGVVLVRPDNYVAVRTPSTSLGPLSDYLSRWLNIQR